MSDSNLGTEALSDEERAILKGEAESEPAESQEIADIPPELDRRPPDERETLKMFKEEGEGKPEPSSEPVKEKTVPLAALRAEREKRQELNSRVEELQKQLEGLQAHKDEPPAVPDPETDPFNHLAHRIGTNEGEIREALSFISEQKQRQKAADEYQQLRTRWNVAAEAYAQQKPDFYDAFGHLVEARTKELEVRGYGPQQIRQILLADEAALVREAESREMDPADVFYNLAVGRGYVGGEPEPGHGAPSSDPVAENVVEMVQKGRSQAAGSTRGGGAPQVKTTLETLADKSPEEIAKAIESGEAAKVWGEHFG